MITNHQGWFDINIVIIVSFFMGCAKRILNLFYFL